MDRLDRHVPGQRVTDPRPLEASLFARDRELRKPHKALGEEFSGRSFKTRDTHHVADPAPNAPLLKRLVLYPYVQEVERPRRGEAYDRSIPWDLLDHERTPHTFQLYRDAKIPPVQGSPLKSIDRTIPQRSRPPVSDWLGGDE